MQEKQQEWLDQWSLFKDEELFLFQDWIFPNVLDDFQGKSVLEAGCGGGQHSGFVATLCKELTSVDLNSVQIAKNRNSAATNISFVEDDIASMDLQSQFDVVFSIGVVHHTDNPDEAVRNLIRHLKPGGRLILWVYSKEGNWITENIVERVRGQFISDMHTHSIVGVSRVITLLMYFPIFSLYLLPLKVLPYYEYFQNFRRLSFERNVLNVFDKLNAPQVQFIDEKRIRKWLSHERFSDVHVSRYKGVSWRVSATLERPSGGSERDLQT